MKTDDLANRTGHILLVGIGWAMLIVAMAMAMHTTVFLSNGEPAQATVTALVTRTDGDVGTVTYSPQFVFKTSDGQSLTVLSGTGSNPPGFHVGQQVNIIYDRTHPTDARIDSFVQIWLLPLIFGFIGITALAIPPLMSHFGRGNRRPPPPA